AGDPSRAVRRIIFITPFRRPGPHQEENIGALRGQHSPGVEFSYREARPAPRETDGARIAGQRRQRRDGTGDVSTGPERPGDRAGGSIQVAGQKRQGRNDRNTSRRGRRRRVPEDGRVTRPAEPRGGLAQGIVLGYLGFFSPE